MGKFYTVNFEAKEYVCQKCNQICKHIKSLQLHLVKKHNFDKNHLKEYYDNHIKNDNEDICLYSGKLTEYINFSKGYEKYAFDILKESRLPTQKLYWVIKHNKTLEEAIQIVSKEQTSRGNKNKLLNTRDHSPRCQEYWMKRFNMNPEAAKLMVSNIQSETARKITPEQHKLKTMTLENCQRRHGLEKGLEIYENYKTKQKNATKIHSSNISQIENTFCHMLELSGFRGRWGKNQRSLFDAEFNNGRNWFYDFSYRNTIIEFYGDYYHGHKPKIEKIRGGKTYDLIMKEDKRKKEFAESCGYYFEIVWEHEFRADPIGIINKYKTLLEERYHVN